MLLKNGSNGEDVKKLQTKLGLAADGAFGPGTEAKVKEWQAANGLGADGMVGEGTWTKMFGATPAAPAATDKPAAPAATEKPASAQQNKMATCNKEADGKKGDERKKFMSECLKAK